MQENVRSIEAGPGHYEYKVKHGATEYPLRRLVVCRNRSVCRLKTSALIVWSEVLHFFYYRIWFIKIAPRLGLHPRPLWRAWIRTRL